MDEFDPMVLQDAHQSFDIKTAKSKQFYKVSLSKTLSYQIRIAGYVEEMLDKIYLLPHNVVNETYAWSFQYRLLNYKLFTNVKLLKIGLLFD